MRHLVSKCKNEKTRLIYYANPSVQHRSMRLKSIQHARITADRVNEIVTMTKATANELGIDILDGAAMTEARWTVCITRWYSLQQLVFGWLARWCVTNDCTGIAF